MKSVTSLLKIMAAQIHYALILLKIGGLKVFVKQLLRQIYSRSVQVGFTLDLQEIDIPNIEAKIKYSLRLASKEDMDEILQMAKTESKDMAQKLIYRRWLYEDGYYNCYIARNADTNELCFMQFMIYPEDDKIIEGRFRSWLPKLKEGEVLLEGAYTFEKCRGNRIHPSVMGDIIKICRKKNFKRVITHIEKHNIASLKGVERLGFSRFEEVPEVKIMFFTFRKYNQTNHG